MAAKNMFVVGSSCSSSGSDDVIRMTTRDLLIDFIASRFGLAGIDIRQILTELGPGFKRDPELTSRLLVHATSFDGNEGHRRYINQLVRTVNLYSHYTRGNFNYVVGTLFPNNTITWGRLVLVMYITSELVAKAAKDKQPNWIAEVVSYCTSYFTMNKFENWIDAKGGWDNLPRQMDRQDLNELHSRSQEGKQIMNADAFLPHEQTVNEREARARVIQRSQNPTPLQHIRGQVLNTMDIVNTIADALMKL